MKRILALSLALLLVGPMGVASAERDVPRKQSLKAFKAVSALEPRALRLFPESFGGLWLGKGDKVFIAFTGRGSRRVEKLEDRFQGSEDLRSVNVDDSLQALRQLQAQMVTDRTSNPPAPRLTYDLEVDIKRNILVATVEEPVTPALTAAFGQRYGEDVLVEQGLLAKPLACSSPFFCAPDLRAGLLIGGSAGNWFCTSAFTAFAGETQYILSAAHCGNDPVPNQGAPPDPGGSRIHGGSTYGVNTFEQQSGRLDAEAHTITDFSLFNASNPWIYVTDSVKQGRVGAVGTYDGLPVGLKVCKSGAKTFRTCGKVLNKTFSPAYVTNGMDFVEAQMCTEPGDSGSAVYHQYTVYPQSKVTQGANAAADIHYRAPK